MSEEKDTFDREAESLRNRISKAADVLREHCDSVVIIATVAEGDSTQMVWQDRGNHWAIEGAMERLLRLKLAIEEKRDSENTEL